MKDNYEISQDQLDFDERLISELRHSFKRINSKRIERLNNLLSENIFTTLAIRKIVLLLSENVRSSDDKLPVSHHIIFNALNRMGSVSIKIDNRSNLLQFVSNLIEEVIDNFSISFKVKEKNWDIEDAVKKRDLLFKYTLQPNEEVKINQYRIKEVCEFKKNLLHYLLPASVLTNFDATEITSFLNKKHDMSSEFSEPFFTFVRE